MRVGPGAMVGGVSLRGLGVRRSILSSQIFAFLELRGCPGVGIFLGKHLWVAVGGREGG